MERQAIKDLKKWKTKLDRKPLIIRGARQTGKTWLMKEFGKNEYSHIAYVNFESSKSLNSLFSDDYDINRIIAAIQIETGIQIKAENTLIILDEIQEAKGAITSLKYFYENAPTYHVISAGSLLGVAMHEQTSFPVGMVEFMDLFPLSFDEFLSAIGQDPLVDLLRNKNWPLIKTFKSKLIQFLRTYYYLGGMPEVVKSFIERNDFSEARAIQKRLLEGYENDFSKYAPHDIVPRIRMLWNSIPAQLAKENRKFIYKAIKPGSRAKDYEIALSWLIDCGLVHKVNKATKPGIPLKSFEDLSAFKLFITDVGLLCAMGDIDVRTLIEGNSIFNEFKGALTEQFVLQQLKGIKDIAIYYWSSEKAKSEIDFLIQHSGKVIPVEVKSEENLQAKSLKTFCRKFSNKNAVRTSMSDFRKEDWMTNLPLYAISKISDIL